MFPRAGPSQDCSIVRVHWTPRRAGSLEAAEAQAQNEAPSTVVMRVTKAGGGTPPGVSAVGRWRRSLDLVMARSLLPSPEQCPWSRGTEAKELEIGEVTGRAGGIGHLAVRPERGCLRRERGWRKGACFKQWGRRDTEPHARLG